MHAPRFMRLAPHRAQELGVGVAQPLDGRPVIAPGRETQRDRQRQQCQGDTFGRVRIIQAFPLIDRVTVVIFRSYCPQMPQSRKGNLGGLTTLLFAPSNGLIDITKRLRAVMFGTEQFTFSEKRAAGRGTPAALLFIDPALISGRARNLSGSALDENTRIGFPPRFGGGFSLGDRPRCQEATGTRTSGESGNREALARRSLAAIPQSGIRRGALTPHRPSARRAAPGRGQGPDARRSMTA